MHLLYYGHNILDLRGFSTAVTVGILIGSGYGFARLVADVLKGAFGVELAPAFGLARAPVPVRRLEAIEQKLDQLLDEQPGAEPPPSRN